MGMFVTACNNNKGKNNMDNPNTNNREKDNYRNNNDNNKNENTKDKDKTTGWTKADEESWMTQCKSQVPQLSEETQNSYCSCVLKKLEAKYSNFEEMNLKGTEQIGVDLGKECIKELGIGANQ